MTWRSDLRKAEKITYLGTRTLEDFRVATGKNGAQRYAQRLGRRWLTRTIAHALRNGAR